jgi:hypothetical protein
MLYFDGLPGIRQNGSITNRNFYDMVALPFVLDVTFRLVHQVEGNRRVVPQDAERLALGNYIIEDLCACALAANCSHKTGSR